MSKLLDCNEVFLKYFDPWYSEADRARRSMPGVFPDLLCHEKFIGKSGRDLSPLTEKVRQGVEDHLGSMLRAAMRDMKSFLAVKEPVNVQWIRAFDKFYDEARIVGLMGESDPANASNAFTVITCEFGVVLAHVMKCNLARLEWVAGWPYWESRLFDPVTGYTICVFDWAMKKMSAYGVDDGYAPKVGTCLGMLEGKNRFSVTGQEGFQKE